MERRNQVASTKTERVYQVVADVRISVSTIVRASSAKEARKKARDRPLLQLCQQCSKGEPTEEWVTSGELDGGPVKLRAHRRKK